MKIGPVNLGEQIDLDEFVVWKKWFTDAELKEIYEMYNVD